MKRWMILSNCFGNSKFNTRTPSIVLRRATKPFLHYEGVLLFLLPIGGDLCRANIHSSLRKRPIFRAKVLIFSQNPPYLREKQPIVPSIFFMLLYKIHSFSTKLAEYQDFLIFFYWCLGNFFGMIESSPLQFLGGYDSSYSKVSPLALKFHSIIADSRL